MCDIFSDTIEQHLANLRRKDFLPWPRNGLSLCCLGRLFCLELCGFCLSESRKATLRLEYVRCGKASCHCAEGDGHGPYYWKTGRLTSQYVGKDTSKFTPG